MNVDELFTAWADRKFGRAPDPAIPQTERFASYFECFKDSASLVLEEAEKICNSKHANGRRKYTHADECANAICTIAEGLKP